jgi:hypothetical protein
MLFKHPIFLIHNNTGGILMAKASWNTSFCSLLIISLMLLMLGLVTGKPPVGTPSPGWLSWGMNYGNTPPNGSGLSQAEFNELLSTLQHIGTFFQKMPHLNPPTGVEISPSRAIQGRIGFTGGEMGRTLHPYVMPARHPLIDWPVQGKGPLKGQLTLGIYRPVFDLKNPTCVVTIQINNPWLEAGILFEDAQGGIYHFATHEKKFADGITRYQFDRRTEVIKFLPQGRDPWLPVSQERWIKVLISRTEETLEERRSKIRDESQQRRQRNMQSYNAMKRVSPEEAEKFLKAFEENEQVFTLMATAIEAEDYDALEAAGDKGMAELGRTRLALKQELASLSPAQRAAPAYGFESDPRMFTMPRRKPKRTSLLLESCDTNAYPLLAPNHSFFRRDLPPGQIQSITIINGLWKEFSDKMDQELDWNGLKQLVK